MVILALDTTTAAGSVAVVCDGTVRGQLIGDPEVSHGRRLPGDVLRLLARGRLSIQDIDLYAVATGPGALTGLRVGIATIQGLALANGRQVVSVSALEALALGARTSRSIPADDAIGVLMEARRGEVFSALFGRFDGGNPAMHVEVLEEPSVGRAPAVLARWRCITDPRHLWLVGDGATPARHAMSALDEDRLIEPVPRVAPALGILAAARVAEAVPPHLVRPLYVRPPDAVLARARRRGPLAGR